MSIDTTPLSLANPLVPNCYNLQLDIDPQSGNFKGHLSIDLTLNNLSDGINDQYKQLKLHGKEIIVTKANINDSIELTINYDKEQELIIFENEKLSELCKDKENLILNIDYIGRVHEITSHIDKTIGLFKVTQNGHTLFSTHAQPSFGRHILPCIDEPSIKTHFKLSIKTLARFNVVSCSNVDKVEKNGTWQTVHFNKSILLPVALFGFTLGDIVSIHTTAKSTESEDTKIPIAIWALKHEPIDLATYALNVLQKYLPLVETIFKFPFPGEKLDLIVLPFLNDIVMENFTMITCHKQLILLNPRDLATRQITFQTMQMLIHELVHHWIGNYVTFDSWTHLWFNEAFATWMANHLITTNESDYEDLWERDDMYWNPILQNTINRDSFLDTQSIVKLQDFKNKQTLTSNSDEKIATTTNDLFDPHCYNKGIVILRSMELTIGIENLQKAFSESFNNNLNQIHNQCIKPMDLWKLVSDKLKSQNIINYFISWTKLQGLPIVSVIEDEQDPKLIKLIQHRFLPATIIKDQEMIEDIPYHVPLLTQLTDGTIDKHNVIMTDRSLSLNYPISLINDNNQANVIVSYEESMFYDQFVKMITLQTMTDNNLFKIIYDLSLIIGNVNSQKKIHIDGFLQILNHIGSLPNEITFEKLNMWKGMKKAMEVLEFLVRSFTLQQNQERLTQIAKIVLKLFNKFDWTNLNQWINQAHDDELTIRSSLLFLTRDDNSTTKEICNKLFQFMKNGQDKDLKDVAIPIILVPSVYKCMVHNASNVQDWKSVLDMHKPSVIEKIVSTGRVEGIQTVDTATLLTNHAMESLGFIPGNPEILDRVLNFISSNIDAPYIDSVFMGLIYNGNCPLDKNTTIGQRTWNLFVKQHKTWTKKLGSETMYFIEFWLIRMQYLMGKIDAEWVKANHPTWTEIYQEVEEDITTQRITTLKQFA